MRKTVIEPELYPQVREMWHSGVSADQIAKLLQVTVDPAKRACEAAFGLRCLRTATTIEQYIRNLEMYYLLEGGCKRDDVAINYGLSLRELDHCVSPLTKEINPIDWTKPRVRIEKVMKRLTNPDHKDAKKFKRLKVIKANAAKVYWTVLVVAKETGVTAWKILTRDRTAKLAQPRQVVMYILNVIFGMSEQDIGFLLRRDRTTIKAGIGNIRRIQLYSPQMDDLLMKAEDGILDLIDERCKDRQ